MNTHNLTYSLTIEMSFDSTATNVKTVLDDVERQVNEITGQDYEIDFVFGNDVNFSEIENEPPDDTHNDF